MEKNTRVSSVKSDSLRGHCLPQGWRMGAILALALVSLSLIINAWISGWLLTHVSSKDELGQIYRGDCENVKSMDSWAHLCINIVSTLMLSGSNYVMQILVGPSRQEVDKAHASGKWLDIGIPSLRNLKHISSWRVALWFILAITSLPLHLMFNSAFYSISETNNYDIILVEEKFLQKGAFFFDVDVGLVSFESYAADPPLNVTVLHQNLGTLQRLNNTECIDAYATDVLNGRRNLVIVTSNTSTSSSHDTVLSWERYIFSYAVNASGIYNPYYWICGDRKVDDHKTSGACRNRISNVKRQPDAWMPMGYKAQYCLSEPVQGQCSFNADMTIIIIILVSNTIKVIVMVCAITFIGSSPLVVVGDAVESFINTPDQTTRTLSMLSKKDICSRVAPWPMANSKISSPIRFPLHQNDLRAYGGTVLAEPKRWRSASSVHRWVGTISAQLVCTVMVFLLLLRATLALQDHSWSHMWELGIGRLNGETLIQGSNWPPSNISSWSGQILASTLIANTPQLVLSFLYLNMNGLLTVMFMADEWSDFLLHRKTLRVSAPKGEQRSTYFLQLPYKIAIPLLTVSTILHWLVSQSIFLAVVVSSNSSGKLATDFQTNDNYNVNDRRLSHTTAIATCGFSPVPMIAVIVIGVVSLLMLALIGMKRYNPFIPVVSSCSAAISAACHIPECEVRPSLKPLQWGVVTDIKDGKTLRYCCLSSEVVEMPEDGKTYLSISEKLNLRSSE